MINGHGDDAWKFSVPILADFSSNVLYGGLDAGLRAHLIGAMDGLTHYPEPEAVALQALIAETYGVDRSAVLVTNGATEAIYLIAQVVSASAQVTVVGPTFAEYEDSFKLYGKTVMHVSWEELRAEEIRGVVFICNPNNPTGRVLPVEEILALADRSPRGEFVIDESYFEFALSKGSMIQHRRGNILILRSLTKSCRIPGLRLGYLVGRESSLRRIRAQKMPWSVNRMAIEAGLYIFRHRGDFVVPLVPLLAATTKWQKELASATGWRIWDTDTHYFLMETPQFFTAAQLKLHLVSRYGLLIRDAGNFRGLGPHHFRVACQSPEQNQLLTEALRECSRGGI